jgi:type IV secretion system protein VirB1
MAAVAVEAGGVMPVDVQALAHQCAPTVAVETIAALVTHESRGNPFAIGINGALSLTRQPENTQEAVQVAKKLLAMGVSIDLGLAQINSANLPRLGLSVEQAFEPCLNLKAAETVLRGCYDAAAKQLGPGQEALKAALSCFNTGDFRAGLANGYVSSIYRASK